MYIYLCSVYMDMHMPWQMCEGQRKLVEAGSPLPPCGPIGSAQALGYGIGYLHLRINSLAPLHSLNSVFPKQGVEF